MAAQRRRPPARRSPSAHRSLRSGGTLGQEPSTGAERRPESTGRRATVERRSAAALVYLHSRPGWILPVVAVALLLTGLAVDSPLAAVPLLIVAAAVGWLVYLSWPAVSPTGRGLRVAALGLLLAAAAGKLTGL